MVLDILIGEAARTVVGSTLGYFVGKWFGSRSKAERCRFLWKLEFEVSPRILRDVIEQEVKAGCISRDEMDDRLYKIMQVRAKYGLGYGADVFASASKSGNRLDVRASAVPPSSPPPAQLSTAIFDAQSPVNCASCFAAAFCDNYRPPVLFPHNEAADSNPSAHHIYAQSRRAALRVPSGTASQRARARRLLVAQAP